MDPFNALQFYLQAKFKKIRGLASSENYFSGFSVGFSRFAVADQDIGKIGFFGFLILFIHPDIGIRLLSTAFGLRFLSYHRFLRHKLGYWFSFSLGRDLVFFSLFFRPTQTLDLVFFALLHAEYWIFLRDFLNQLLLVTDDVKMQRDWFENKRSIALFTQYSKYCNQKNGS
ncbi:MAG: hypothetical protein ACOYKE_03805 [Ferruginibacter sp.]